MNTTIEIHKKMSRHLVIQPIFGLSNRLRAIASAYSICKNKNIKLTINWIKSDHCDCLIEDLVVNIHEFADVIYKPISKTLESDFKFYNYLETEEGSVKNEYIDVDNFDKIYVKSNCILNNKYSHLYFKEFLQSLKWNDDINNLINSIPDISNYIGMHIRMEGGKNFQDNTYEISNNWTIEESKLLFKFRKLSHIDNFINQINNILHNNPKQKIFIATDMKINYEKLINIYGDDTIKLLKRSVFNRSKEQIYYAIADIILLSRCKQFYGSTWSSLSEMVTYFQSEEKKHNFFSDKFNNIKNETNSISICYACKNRHDNLIKSIESIINNNKINDIVVVDWNTDEINLYELLKSEIQTEYFWKINYIKIIDKVPWILSYAYNLSFLHAKNQNVIKSDCDYIFSDHMINYLSECDTQKKFYSFDWRCATTKNQCHLNGFFYFNKDILKKSSYFNNNILFYGFDDCHLKECFEKAGFTYEKLHINDKDLYHIQCKTKDRVINQHSYYDFTGINFFGYDVKNFKNLAPLIQYNDFMCRLKLYNNITSEKDVLNKFKLKNVSYRYAEYSFLYNKIQTYNSNCNYLCNKKTISRFEVFSKMKEIGYYWNTNKIHYGNIISQIEKKYNVVDIKDSINLFIFFICNNTKKIENCNHLVISLYNEKNINRSIELLYCLRQNLNNESISKVHILIEDIINIQDYKTRKQRKNLNYFLLECILELIENFELDNKIVLVPLNTRPTFNDYFKYCNKNITGNVIIANADIVYDDTINKIENIAEDEFIVLTRYQKYNNTFKLLHFDKENYYKNLSSTYLNSNHNKVNIFSQDTWIFKSPMYDNINIPYFVGSKFSNNFINYTLNKKSKYIVYNKSKFIKSYHIQNKKKNTYELESYKKAEEKFYVNICKLLNCKKEDFIMGVPIQEINGYQEIMVNWETFMSFLSI